MLDMMIAKYWLLMVLGGGFIALLFFILSVVGIMKNTRVAGLVFAILELLAARLSVSAWMWALESSGKPLLWFGFSYSPLMSLICTCMVAVGVICVVVNIIGLIKRRNVHSTR